MKNYTFAIYGNPVAHSKSPIIHNNAFLKLGLNNYFYTRVKLENGDELIESFNMLALNGANITVPFKENAFRQCDEVRGLACDIQAVNTLVKENEKIVGYNTDCDGFMKSIEEFNNIKKVLIIGAGGTAKAIAIALKNSKIECLVLNRSKKRLEFFIKNQIKSYDWENYQNSSYDLIINTTSAGLDDDLLPAPEEIIRNIIKNSKYAYDVIYNKLTPFLSMAEKNELICKNGKDMLVYQAVYAFERFSGVNDFEKISKIMKKAINF